MTCGADRLASMAAPSTSEFTLYSPGAGKSVLLTEILICNTTGGAVTVRLSLITTGSTATNKDWLLYEKSLAAGESYFFEPPTPIWLRGASALTARSSATNVAFQVYGDGGIPS
jgi:hypothetical protein